MTLTISDDCTLITLDSDLFVVDNTAVSLTLVHNGSTEYEIAVNANNIAPIEIDATLLGITELEEGIYQATLVVTAEDASQTTEIGCVASICSVHCDIISDYTSTDNMTKILAYEALKMANNCITCSCSTMNTLYSTITDTPDANNCGCS